MLTGISSTILGPAIVGTTVFALGCIAFGELLKLFIDMAHNTTLIAEAVRTNRLNE